MNPIRALVAWIECVEGSLYGNGVMKTTTKFIVVKVQVLHEDRADVAEVCEEVVIVNNDHELGEIVKSEVVGVLDKMPTW